MVGSTHGVVGFLFFLAACAPPLDGEDTAAFADDKSGEAVSVSLVRGGTKTVAATLSDAVSDPAAPVMCTDEDGEVYYATDGCTGPTDSSTDAELNDAPHGLITYFGTGSLTPVGEEAEEGLAPPLPTATYPYFKGYDELTQGANGYAGGCDPVEVLPQSVATYANHTAVSHSNWFTYVMPSVVPSTLTFKVWFKTKLADDTWVKILQNVPITFYLSGSETPGAIYYFCYAIPEFQTVNAYTSTKTVRKGGTVVLPGMTTQTTPSQYHNVVFDKMKVLP